MTFNFDELPPTLNQLIGKRWVSHNAKKRWIFLLKEKLGQYQPPIPCAVSVTWRVMKHQDDDNARGRFKVIGDALKRAGYIPDDNQDCLRLVKVDEVVVHHLNEQGFTITLEEYLPFT